MTHPVPEVGERGGAAGYGDVTSEYLAARRGAAAVTGWHDLVWVRGPDTVGFLDGLVSQAVESMGTGTVAPSLLLAPQGKLRAPHLLLRGDDEVGLLTDVGTGETVAGDLARFKIRVDAVIEPETAAVLDVWGPRSAEVVATVTGFDPPATGWARRGEVAVIAVPFARAPLARLAVVGVAVADLVAAGAVRAGRLAVDAVRIEAGEPLMGVDVDERTIPQEGGLVEGAVDFTKGCYLGQELVARIDSRGHVNRNLRGVVVTDTVLPPPGAELVAGEKVVGSLTSIGESLDLRAPVGLALVRREVEEGSSVTIRWDGGTAAARIESLPLDVWGP